MTSRRALKGQRRLRLLSRLEWRSRPRLAAVVGLLVALAGCAGPAVRPPTATTPSATAVAPGATGGKVYLLTHGWHTDIAVPVAEVSGPLRMFLDRYPGARNLVFGYGRRNYMIERDHDWGDLLAGAIPGAGALEVSAIPSDPATAYGAAHTMVIDLPPGGAALLSDFVWRTLSKNAAGEPIEAGPGSFPGSIIFDAASGYDLNHTCNTWSAEALAAAGLPIHAQGIIFSRQIDAEAQRFAAPAEALAGGR